MLPESFKSIVKNKFLKNQKILRKSFTNYIRHFVPRDFYIHYIIFVGIIVKLEVWQISCKVGKYKSVKAIYPVISRGEIQHVCVIAQVTALSAQILLLAPGTLISRTRISCDYMCMYIRVVHCVLTIEVWYRAL